MWHCPSSTCLYTVKKITCILLQYLLFFVLIISFYSISLFLFYLLYKLLVIIAVDDNLYTVQKKLIGKMSK